MISAAILSVVLAAQPEADAKVAAQRVITPVSWRQVAIDGPFWSPRMQAIRRGTLAANRHQCDITGRLANFDNAAKKLRGERDHGEFQGLLFNDSDVYKMIEGWSYLLATEKDAAAKEKLDSELDALISRIAAAQHEDGYINTYYTLKADIKNRFTREEWDHETYCIGHLIEAGVAHFEATGKRSLLDVAVRAADFLDHLYGEHRFTAPPGHQEVELALVRLSAVERDNTYTKLAHYLIEQRGRPHRKLDGTMYGPWGDYAQDHLPAAEQMEAAGHAVRAAYMYCAMADLARLGLGHYRPALDALWTDITQRRVFVTGGIGPSGHNEGFTTPYDIPTHSAYQETCASIGLCMWAHRMFLLTGRAEYMEQFERTLYNAVLAGVALDGESFFYVNPLASRGGHRRSAWFACACCPPNVLRFLASLGQYAYAVGSTGEVYINLHIAGEARIEMPDGSGRIIIRQETAYPFEGACRLTIDNRTPRPVTIARRLDVAMVPSGAVSVDGYVRWNAPPGATVHEMAVPLHTRRVVADHRVKQAIGRVAIMRGPLVYAAESIDNPGISPADIVLPPDARLEERAAADGTPEIVAHALRIGPPAAPPQPGGLRPYAPPEPPDDRLYVDAPGTTAVELVMRPYFMWANRGPSEMVVWLPESAHLGQPRPARGISASASFIGHGDGLPALFDRIEPASSNDHDIPRFTFWNRKGTSEWVRYDFDAPRVVSAVEVYWFDDTGRGECRVPASWNVEVLGASDRWRPVNNASPDYVAKFETARDRFNVCVFSPVTTTAVRVNIQLQDKFSGGILELRVR
ncbi:MAG: glycoside hydrolase family 127 protein [Phycisphaeraceae bacterium]|nr:glycoside hydrolase family 127 protein [Phycisphaeraceae bacterium]